MNIILKVQHLYNNNVIFKRFLKIFSVDLLVKLSGFILLPVYLKLMTQDEFGLYGYFLSIIGTFALVLNFGFYTPQSKLYHDFKGMSRSTLLFTINAMLVIFLALVLAPLYLTGADKKIVSFLVAQPISYDKYRWIVFAAILVSVFSSILYNFFMTSEKIVKVQTYNVLKLFLINGLAVLFLIISGRDGVFIRLVFTFGTEGVILFFFYFFYISEMHFHFDFAKAKRALAMAVPALLSALIGILYNISDRFFIAHFTKGFANMAVYNVGVTVAGIIGLMFSSFNNIWMPLFFKEKDIHVNDRNTGRAALVLTAVFLFVSTGLFIITWGLLYVHIIDKKYSDVLRLLPLLFLAQIIQSLAFLYNNYMAYFEKVFMVTIIGAAASILMLVLNYILVPMWNIYGAAVALVLVSFFTLASFYTLARFFIRSNMKGALK